MKIKRSLSDPLMALKMLLLCEDLTLAATSIIQARCTRIIASLRFSALMTGS
jgi:hypothetical protein